MMPGKATEISGPMLLETPRHVPSRRVKASYALGQAVQSGGFDTAFGFIFFYYTAGLGLSGSAVGLALAASLAVDAVVDPVLGSMSDGLRTRMGRRLPMMMATVPFFTVALVLLFSPPRHAASGLLFGWLTASAIATRCALSVFIVPYTALGAELADGYVERSRIAAWRILVGLVTQLALTVAAFGFFLAGPMGLRNVAAYPPLGLMIALVVAACATAGCLGIRRYAAQLPQPLERPGSLVQALPGEVAEIFRNGSFRVLFLTAVAFFSAVGVSVTLAAHVNVFVWRLSPAQIPIAGYVAIPGILAGTALTATLQKRFEKKTVVIAGLVLTLAPFLVLSVLRALNLFHSVGTAALGPLMVQSAVTGFGLGLASVTFASMMADAADEHEFLFNHRREGLYFAGLGFAGKAASGVGVLVGGLVLDLIGFPHDASAHPGLILSEPLSERLILGWGVLPGVVGLFATAALFAYKISRDRHDLISAELRVRRAAT